MKVLVSDKAKLDLLRTYSFVAQHSPAAATAIVRRIDVRLRQLSRFPFIGGESIVVRVTDQRMDIDEEFRR
jgi:plasmid stabilization system protein ParE